MVDQPDEWLTSFNFRWFETGYRYERKDMLLDALNELENEVFDLMNDESFLVSMKIVSFFLLQVLDPLIDKHPQLKSNLIRSELMESIEIFRRSVQPRSERDLAIAQVVQAHTDVLGVNFEANLIAPTIAKMSLKADAAELKKGVLQWQSLLNSFIYGNSEQTEKDVLTSLTFFYGEEYPTNQKNNPTNNLREVALLISLIIKSLDKISWRSYQRTYSQDLQDILKTNHEGYDSYKWSFDGYRTTSKPAYQRLIFTELEELIPNKTKPSHDPYSVASLQETAKKLDSFCTSILQLWKNMDLARHHMDVRINQSSVLQRIRDVIEAVQPYHRFYQDDLKKLLHRFRPLSLINDKSTLHFKLMDESYRYWDLNNPFIQNPGTALPSERHFSDALTAASPGVSHDMAADFYKLLLDTFYLSSRAICLINTKRFSQPPKTSLNLRSHHPLPESRPPPSSLWRNLLYAPLVYPVVHWQLNPLLRRKPGYIRYPIMAGASIGGAAAIGAAAARSRIP
ncbi:hypothetical protein GUITHDRAFT_121658 [Guillardia theta CCMP2712]|uniref:Uncharacterized protein n=1 Tax=Guillardia theta (strain CCMP2712) TaxID=905079 RepID=L1I8E1_GUITC|nr:hypothetical protein GUITHDRAFT_121658 [Guillardia theta CCMP2712]EKX32164.1 hypothetical protein GUITHDRAFT_121658 [Guillardia theta CCMP2712]|eukprot:XP_005819144.1 hypothetical protein GUITHDRAFT_121658 [Guillardia theta CCMP2712]